MRFRAVQNMVMAELQKFTPNNVLFLAVFVFPWGQLMHSWLGRVCHCHLILIIIGCDGILPVGTRFVEWEQDWVTAVKRTREGALLGTVTVRKEMRYLFISMLLLIVPIFSMPKQVLTATSFQRVDLCGMDRTIAIKPISEVNRQFP